MGTERGKMMDEIRRSLHNYVEIGFEEVRDVTSAVIQHLPHVCNPINSWDDADSRHGHYGTCVYFKERPEVNENSRCIVGEIVYRLTGATLSGYEGAWTVLEFDIKDLDSPTRYWFTSEARRFLSALQGEFDNDRRKNRNWLVSWIDFKANFSYYFD